MQIILNSNIKSFFNKSRLNFLLTNLNHLIKLVFLNGFFKKNNIETGPNNEISVQVM